MPHLLILSRHAREFQQLIQSSNLPDLTIFAAQDLIEARVYARNCEIVFGEPSLVCQVIEEMTHLRWVQATWAGVEPLLVEEVRRDYTLTNIRGVYGPMISEYVFSYLLAIERGILPRWQAQQARRWDESLPGTLRGKLLGLLGVGSIGAYLAHTARCFGMHAHGYTRQTEDSPDIERYYHSGERLDFMRGLDYLVCILPGTDQTRGIVDKDMLQALPAHAWLVNVGRGSTLDENALVSALHSGQLAGAVLDVFQEEPLPPNSPLWSAPNTFITAHIAARNYPPDIVALFIENYRRFLSGEALKHVVNFEQGY